MTIDKNTKYSELCIDLSNHNPKELQEHIEFLIDKWQRNAENVDSNASPDDYMRLLQFALAAKQSKVVEKQYKLAQIQAENAEKQSKNANSFTRIAIGLSLLSIILNSNLSSAFNVLFSLFP